MLEVARSPLIPLQQLQQRVLQTGAPWDRVCPFEVLQDLTMVRSFLDTEVHGKLATPVSAV